MKNLRALAVLSAVVADGMAGTKHDSNQELVGQGVANIAAPLFGGFAATGAIARTATNVRNGGTGPLAGMTHAVTLVLNLAGESLHRRLTRGEGRVGPAGLRLLSQVAAAPESGPFSE